jgi:hypothetical protein
MLPPNFFYCVTSQPARRWSPAWPEPDAPAEDPAPSAAPPAAPRWVGPVSAVSTAVVALVHLRLTHH